MLGTDGSLMLKEAHVMEVKKQTTRVTTITLNQEEIETAILQYVVNNLSAENGRGSIIADTNSVSVYEKAATRTSDGIIEATVTLNAILEDDES